MQDQTLYRVSSRPTRPAEATSCLAQLLDREKGFGQAESSAATKEIGLQSERPTIDCLTGYLTRDLNC